MAQETISQKIVKQIAVIKDREGNTINVYAGKIFTPQPLSISKS